MNMTISPQPGQQNVLSIYFLFILDFRQSDRWKIVSYHSSNLDILLFTRHLAEVQRMRRSVGEEDFPGPRCCGRAQDPDFICHIDLLLPLDGWLGLGCISWERSPTTWLGPWDLTSVGKLPRGLFSSTKDHAVFQAGPLRMDESQDGRLQWMARW